MSERTISERDTALVLAGSYLRNATPIHPRTRDHLKEIIGQTTPEEEQYLADQRRAGEAEREWAKEGNRIVAEAAARLRKALGYDE